MSKSENDTSRIGTNSEYPKKKSGIVMTCIRFITESGQQWNISVYGNNTGDQEKTSVF